MEIHGGGGAHQGQDEPSRRQAIKDRSEPGIDGHRTKAATIGFPGEGLGERNGKEGSKACRSDASEQAAADPEEESEAKGKFARGNANGQPPTAEQPRPLRLWQELCRQLQQAGPDECQADNVNRKQVPRQPPPGAHELAPWTVGTNVEKEP